LQQFYDSPWVGSAIIELQFYDYPHNVFIEGAMAVGLAGLLLLVFIILRAVRRIFRALRQGSLLVPLLALQMLTAAQVSGSISQSASMWMFLALFAGAAVRQSRHLPSSGLVAHAPHPLKIK
jgi:O-antigen ligase